MKPEVSIARDTFLFILQTAGEALRNELRSLPLASITQAVLDLTAKTSICWFLLVMEPYYIFFCSPNYAHTVLKIKSLIHPCEIEKSKLEGTFGDHLVQPSVECKVLD